MRFSLFLKYGIILVLFPAVYIGFNPGKIVIIQTVCWGILLFFFVKKWKSFYYRYFRFDIFPYFFIYVGYCVLTYIRGFFNIVSQEDVIQLASGLLFTSFLLPFFLLLGTPYDIQKLWKSYMIWGLILCLICYFVPPSDGMMSFAHNMSFLNVLILCIPYLRMRYKIVVIAFVIMTIFYDLNRRSILINNIVPFIILVLYYSFLYKTVFNKLLISLLIVTPILFFILGVYGSFNIFKYMENVSDYSISDETRSLTTDSRSGIYEDVLSEIDHRQAYIWGLGGNGKTPTSLIKHGYGDIYRFGRPGTESGMLNHIQYGGLLGFLSYGLLLIVAAFKASNSKNDFMRMLGTFIAFKFLYSFIEDQITTNAQTVYLFLWISMCYNVRFRQMSNRAMIRFFNRIFRWK